MSLDLACSARTALPLRPARKKKWIIVALYSYIILAMAFSIGEHHDAKRSHDRWDIAFSSIAILSSLLIIGIEFFPISFSRRILGPLYISHKWYPLTDPEIVKRVHSRYYAEMKDLYAIGFSPLFLLGESISTASFALILPALTHFEMQLHDEVLTRGGRFTSVRATAVMANPEKGAYAEPIGRGVVFRTRLNDGTVIATDNFGENYYEGKSLRFAQKGSISEAWEKHLETLRSCEASGTPICMEIASQTYIHFFT